MPSSSEIQTVKLPRFTGAVHAQQGFFAEVEALENPEINSPFPDRHPKISPDGLELYFDSDRTGGAKDMFVAIREDPDLPFGEVRPLDELNTADDEAAGHISADGLTLYFSSRGLGGEGENDLWLARREDRRDPFGAAENLGPGVNTEFSDSSPSLSVDGLELYFQSRRPGGAGLLDLYVATRDFLGAAFGNVRNLAQLNTAAKDSVPSLSSGGLTLFFVRATDIWVATRQSTADDFADPVNLGPPVNTSTRADMGPSISFDWPSSRSTLYFTRCTSLTECDIYQAIWHLDCNENGVDDLDDIKNGTSQDADGNDKPDECESALGLSCTRDGSTVDLSWTIEGAVDVLRILRNGDEIDTVPGDATSYQDLNVPRGTLTYQVSPIAPNGPLPGASCEVRDPAIPCDFFEIAPNGFFDCVGGSSQLNVICTDKRGEPLPAEGTTYSVVPEGVVSVDENGRMTALSEGQAEIRVSLGDLTAIAQANVVSGCVDLGDVVAGGDGTGLGGGRDGDREFSGIHPDTGAFGTEDDVLLYHDPAQEEARDDDGVNPAPVEVSDYVDSVFIIDRPTLAINSTGAEFSFDENDTEDKTWGHILSNLTHNFLGADDESITVGVGEMQLIGFGSCVGIHASAGITFDLDELQSEHGNVAFEGLSAVVGHAPTCDCLNLTAYVIFSTEDEVVGDVYKQAFNWGDPAMPISLAIPAEASFLTLAVGSQNNDWCCDGGVFADARIFAASETGIGVRFKRGDDDGDGMLSVGDAIFSLSFQFLGKRRSAVCRRSRFQRRPED